MIRLIIALSFFSMPIWGAAQSPFFGLYASNCIESGSGISERRVNKPILLLYSRDYCWLTLPNGSREGFRVINYSKSLDTVQKSINETFLNAENNVIPEGHYMIMVDQTSKGFYFQIVMPGITYFADKAERYSENGKVPAGAMKIDWAKVRAEQRKVDSAMAVWKLQEQQRKDSIIADRQAEIHLHDSLMQVAKRMHIFTGDNPPTSWLIAVIKSRSDTSHIRKQP